MNRGVRELQIAPVRECRLCLLPRCLQTHARKTAYGWLVLRAFSCKPKKRIECVQEQRREAVVFQTRHPTGSSDVRQGAVVLERCPGATLCPEPGLNTQRVAENSVIWSRGRVSVPRPPSSETPGPSGWTLASVPPSGRLSLKYSRLRGETGVCFVFFAFVSCCSGKARVFQLAARGRWEEMGLGGSVGGRMLPVA